VYGARVSLGFAAIVMGLVMGISITLGMFSGYLGGKVDDMISIVILHYDFKDALKIGKVRICIIHHKSINKGKFGILGTYLPNISRICC